jgi:hypothetical protein
MKEPASGAAGVFPSVHETAHSIASQAFWREAGPRRAVEPNEPAPAKARYAGLVVAVKRSGAEGPISQLPHYLGIAEGNGR